MKQRLAAVARSASFHPWWYLTRWTGRGQLPGSFGEFGRLAKHLRFAERTTRHLGRAIFHAMLRFGAKLERRQMVLFRAVDIGAELFAIAAACTRARMLEKQGNAEAVALADLFCRQARARVEQRFRELYGPTDVRAYKLAQRVLAGDHRWLEAGIVGLTTQPPRATVVDPEARSLRKEEVGVGD
jgi:hypothetical protein